MLWDIFCKVIDNHGDIGVCWRLARELGERGHAVRLWADDASALAWMAPEGHARVQVVPWTADAPVLEPGDVVIEAFGCDPPNTFVAALAARTKAKGRQPPWINLEYLSAEPYVERSHGLPSPVSSGPGAGLLKHFLYPGFTARTGGLLRERGLTGQQAGFDRAAWLASQGIAPGPDRLVSLFCYEPAALPGLLRQLAEAPQPTHLLVTAGRARRAVEAALAAGVPAPRITYLPLLTQPDYDRLLWACDFNFVRGEDSLVRAFWAGKPFAWQLYPQDDGAHLVKLEAFLGWLAPAPALAAFFRGWNDQARAQLPPLDPAGWAAAAASARDRALALPELAESVERFVAGQGTI